MLIKKCYSEETKKRMSIAQTGHKVTDETRKKMSKVKRNFYNKLNANTPSDKNYYLYIMSDNDGLLKIGVSGNPENRVKELICDFNPKINIIDIYFGNYNEVYKIETKLHHKYDNYNVILEEGFGRTEWFNDEILEKVKQDFENIKNGSFT